MELVVFDLDGTLLNGAAEISDYTSETLRLLAEQQIAYTVATGRTLHGARAVLDGHRFVLPQAYKNGVMIWHPDTRRLSSFATLTPDEIHHVTEACTAHGLTPFVFTLDADDGSSVYHPPTLTSIERELIRNIGVEEQIRVRGLDELTGSATVTHINAIGDGRAIESVLAGVSDEPHLVAYSGEAFEGEQWRWLDIHHSDASKGGAVRQLKEMLGLERIVCFGDSHNDLSMFEVSDESYAPENANDDIKAAATAVIGHHDDEGIARFLRQRFDLGG